MSDFMRSSEFAPGEDYCEEEDDSDLDGFIAHDEEEENYSSEICKIFRYDRSR